MTFEEADVFAKDHRERNKQLWEGNRIVLIMPRNAITKVYADIIEAVKRNEYSNKGILDKMNLLDSDLSVFLCNEDFTYTDLDD